MAQFDVYKNLNERTQANIPYLLDIQNDILKNLSSRVIIPMVLDIEPINFLNPKFNINGVEVLLSTQEISTIPMEILGDKICSLKDKREEIIGSIDFLITGF